MPVEPTKSEADLAPIAADWLQEQGLEVHAEVPHFGRLIDLVGVSPTRLVAVELKLILNRPGLIQAITNQVTFAESWLFYCAVTRSANRLREDAVDHGIGLAHVPFRTIKTMASADVRAHRPNSLNVAEMRAYLDQDTPSRDAGRPSERGEGPAQRAHDGVMAFLEREPDADWRTIHARVPNPYATPNGLRQAVRRVAGRRVLQDGTAYGTPQQLHPRTGG